jgi:16S rRNA (guanine(966)-N(2))-methyltransferase RsmD
MSRSTSDAGRVIAGSARGVRLQAAPATRPLGDRVKQSAFAILEPDLPGARFLDLFAGSGAGGIEALSRGAKEAVFVERDSRSVAAIKRNLAAAGLDRAAIVIQRDVGVFLAERPGPSSFDVILVDPPYADVEELTAVLEVLGAASALLGPEARVVAKHFWRDPPPATIGLLASDRVERFGETALTFYRRRPTDTSDQEGR